MSLDTGVPSHRIMKTGIEKFENVISDETCDLLINHIKDNIDNSADLKYTPNGEGNLAGYNNVICRQLFLSNGSNLDDLVYKSISKVVNLYGEKYSTFVATGDTGYQLRRISGATRSHIDNIYDFANPNAVRNTSIILGLNSDYEEGQFHFPFQDFSTTVKRGEAIIFPVYFLYPHSVDAPVGYRYTINTWVTTNKK